MDDNRFKENILLYPHTCILVYFTPQTIIRMKRQ